MNGLINPESYKKLRDEIDKTESISDYLELLGYTVKPRMNCIFHKDNTPSFDITEGGYKWGCYSCGRGGRYFELRYQCYVVFEGGTMSRQMYLEYLLSRNREWRKKYGIETLTAKVEFNLSSIEYMFEEKRLSRALKKTVFDDVRNMGYATTDTRQVVWDNLNSLPTDEAGVKEILEYVAAIQRGETGFN